LRLEAEFYAPVLDDEQRIRRVTLRIDRLSLRKVDQFSTRPARCQKGARVEGALLRNHLAATTDATTLQSTRKRDATMSTIAHK
jgi:hypothetical protein